MSENFNYDWASVTKAQLSSTDDEGQRERLQPGIYDAAVTDVRAAKTKNGAFGVTKTAS